MPLFSKGRKGEENQKIKEEQLKDERTSRLKQLIPENPKLYQAMSNFILADPENQIRQLGGSDSLLTMGNEAVSHKDKFTARLNYEYAAKIEIYKQNKDSVRKFLLLAEEVSEKVDPHREFRETLLANIAEVIRISKLYFDHATPDK